MRDCLSVFVIQGGMLAAGAWAFHSCSEGEGGLLPFLVLVVLGMLFGIGVLVNGGRGPGSGESGIDPSDY